MKRYVLMLFCLISLSGLFCQTSLKPKFAAQLGFANGASVGLKINPKAETSRDYYINAAFCYNQDLLLMAGLNHEIRFNHSKSFYTHLVTGVDYYKMDPLFYDLGGSDSEDKDKKSGLSPHISGGLGFRSAIGKDVHLYIELDVGIKASIANINIGIMM